MSAITTTFTMYWVSYAYDEYLQESRMREIRKSGSTRESNGIGNSPPVALYSTERPLFSRGHSATSCIAFFRGFLIFREVICRNRGNGLLET